MFSCQSVNVLMGMEFFSKFPGLVVERPLRPPTCRYGRSTRSMVEGLIRQSCSSVEASICCSPYCLSLLAISGIKGCRRFEHALSLASQTAFSASCTPVPYLRGRPRRLAVLDWLGRFNNLIAALRCKPVTWVNSSNILPFSSFDAPKYLFFNACAYSIMLRRVTFYLLR